MKEDSGKDSNYKEHKAYREFTKALTSSPSDTAGMDTDDDFMKAWLKAKNGPSGTLLKLINDIKEKFNVSYEYTCDGCIRFLKYGIEVHESQTETIQKYVIESEANLNTPPISKYYQKQYEKYMKPSVKNDIQEAFFENVKSEPEKTHRYNLRGI